MGYDPRRDPVVSDLCGFEEALQAVELLCRRDAARAVRSEPPMSSTLCTADPNVATAHAPAPIWLRPEAWLAAEKPTAPVAESGAPLATIGGYCPSVWTATIRDELRAIEEAAHPCATVNCALVVARFPASGAWCFLAFLSECLDAQLWFAGPSLVQHWATQALVVPSSDEVGDAVDAVRQTLARVTLQKAAGDRVAARLAGLALETGVVDLVCDAIRPRECAHLVLDYFDYWHDPRRVGASRRGIVQEPFRGDGMFPMLAAQNALAFS